MTPVIFSLGSNQGDKADTIAAALDLLHASEGLRLTEASRYYRTAPWGVTDQDWFVNVCARGYTAFSPQALLTLTQSVEKQLGRVKTDRWGPRVIDIDILFYGDATITEPDLTIPHKSILERAFVLIPLQDVAPCQIVSDLTIDDALAKLPLETNDIVALPIAPWRGEMRKSDAF